MSQTRKVHNMKIVGSALLALMLAAAVAPAETIDFTVLAPGTPVTNQYAGVTFSLVGGEDPNGAPTTTWNYQGSSQGGLTNTRYGGDYPTAQFLVATFSSPVTGVVFSFYDAGFNGGNAYTLYDASHTVITSALMPEASDDSYTYDLSTYNGVSEIWWDNGFPAGTRSWWQDLQSLSFASSVPEPATWALLSSAMLGLLFLRRKRN